jgi:hypothetical protein
MKKSYRYITSLLLAMVYLLTVFSPLAPLAMQSKLVAHAVTGECTGDCRIDGCSLERCADHTCCCWQKKQREIDDSHHHTTADVCDTHPAPPAEASGKSTSGCSIQAREADENAVESESVSNPEPQKKRATTVSSRPCGNGTLFALLNVEITHHLPFFFTGEIPSPIQSTLTFISPDRLTSRYGDPPDPPPRHFVLS